MRVGKFAGSFFVIPVLGCLLLYLANDYFSVFVKNKHELCRIYFHYLEKRAIVLTKVFRLTKFIVFLLERRFCIAEIFPLLKAL